MPACAGGGGGDLMQVASMRVHWLAVAVLVVVSVSPFSSHTDDTEYLTPFEDPFDLTQAPDLALPATGAPNETEITALPATAAASPTAGASPGAVDSSPSAGWTEATTGSGGGSTLPTEPASDLPGASEADAPLGSEAEVDGTQGKATTEPLIAINNETTVQIPLTTLPHQDSTERLSTLSISDEVDGTQGKVSTIADQDTTERLPTLSTSNDVDDTQEKNTTDPMMATGDETTVEVLVFTLADQDTMDELLTMSTSDEVEITQEKATTDLSIAQSNETTAQILMTTPTNQNTTERLSTLSTSDEVDSTPEKATTDLSVAASDGTTVQVLVSTLVDENTTERLSTMSTSDEVESTQEKTTTDPPITTTNGTVTDSTQSPDPSLTQTEVRMTTGSTLSDIDNVEEATATGTSVVIDDVALTDNTLPLHPSSAQAEYGTTAVATESDLDVTQKQATLDSFPTSTDETLIEYGLGSNLPFTSPVENQSPTVSTQEVDVTEGDIEVDVTEGDIEVDVTEGDIEVDITPLYDTTEAMSDALSTPTGIDTVSTLTSTPSSGDSPTGIPNNGEPSLVSTGEPQAMSTASLVTSSGPTTAPVAHEKSFDGSLRIVSINNQAAVFNASLEDPSSPFYRHLKAQVEGFLDSLYGQSPLTSGRYLGSTVRRFRSGSVVVDFGALLGGGSDVTEATLASVVTAALQASGGTLPGTDIGLDPTATTIKPTNECELGLDDCSANAACEDLGANGYTCRCLEGTVDAGTGLPGRVCLQPTAAAGSTSGTSAPTAPSSPAQPPGATRSGPGATAGVKTTTEDNADDGSSMMSQGWQIGAFVVGTTVGILILAAVFHNLLRLRGRLRKTPEDADGPDDRSAGGRTYLDRSWSFMYRGQENEGSADAPESTHGGTGTSDAGSSTAVVPSAPPLEEDDAVKGHGRSSSWVQTDPIPGDSPDGAAAIGDGMDETPTPATASQDQAPTDSTTLEMEGDGEAKTEANEADSSTSDGCSVM